MAVAASSARFARQEISAPSSHPSAFVVRSSHVPILRDGQGVNRSADFSRDSFSWDVLQTLQMPMTHCEWRTTLRTMAWLFSIGAGRPSLGCPVPHLLPSEDEGLVVSDRGNASGRRLPAPGRNWYHQGLRKTADIRPTDSGAFGWLRGLQYVHGQTLQPT